MRARCVLLFLTVSVVGFGPRAAEGLAAPEPEPVEVETSDGVTLRGTYYPPDNTPRAPIAVLLHDDGESRAMLAPLAKRLQSAGEDASLDEATKSWGVLAIDLRGQGDSSQQRLPGGGTRNLGGMKLSRAALTAMVMVDMEAVRTILVDKNDAGDVNLNQLAYLGVGVGALVATNAAAVDWSQPRLNTGKQGQDVKALVLVSPPWSVKGVGMLKALRQPGVRRDVATMLLYGKEDRRSAADAERIRKQLDKGRRDAGGEGSESLPSLLDVGSNSSLRGSAWLKQAGDDGERLVLQFLNQHVAEHDNMPWAKRRID